MSQPDPYSTDNTDSVDAEREQRRARAELLRDYRWLLKEKRGRRMAWRWLDEAGVFRSSFNTTAMMMAFNEGTRNSGLKLWSDLQEASPLLCQQMTTENLEPRDESNDD